jgi:predicted nucleic-acid-binding Zn-ribbon protein
MDYKCTKCGGQEFITQLNRYDVFSVNGAKLEHTKTEQIDEKIILYCRNCFSTLLFSIKVSTQENDLIQILFGGSGSEIVLCKNLKRNFISSELHKPYYDMIIDRLKNNGVIQQSYRLQNRKRRTLSAGTNTLFDESASLAALVRN